MCATVPAMEICRAFPSASVGILAASLDEAAAEQQRVAEQQQRVAKQQQQEQLQQRRDEPRLAERKRLGIWYVGSLDDMGSLT